MTRAEIQRKHLVLAALNGLLLAAFSWRFISLRNYEFLIYVGVIVAAVAALFFSYSKIRYGFDTLVGLTVWSALHMAGGGLRVGGERLYEFMLLPMSSTMPIFRYDQFVHIAGFGVGTLLMHDLLAANFPGIRRPSASSMIVLVMAGLGLGAFNEIVEFFVSQILQESGVGGYLNTSLDLCANLIGALLAIAYIRFCRGDSTESNQLSSS